MKRTLILFVILGLAFCGVAQAQNELANPSFEDIAVPMDPDPIDPTDAANWNEFMSANGVSQRVTTMPRTDLHSMELIVDGSNGFAGVFQTLNRAISPGALVTFSGWNKSLGQPFGATRELKIEWIGAPQLRVDSLGPIGSDYEPFVIAGVAPRAGSSAPGSRRCNTQTLPNGTPKETEFLNPRTFFGISGAGARRSAGPAGGPLGGFWPGHIA